MHHDPTASDVVLSPHPDDAVLSTWSVLTGERPLTVVNVCAANPAAGTLGEFDAIYGVDDSAALMRARLLEDEQVLALVGCTPRNLDFLDAQYRQEPLEPVALRVAIEDSLAGVATLWAPVGIGGHPDHLAVRDVAVALSSDHEIPLRLYAELPYAARAGWPHWVTGASARPHLVPDARWREPLDSLPFPASALTPHPVVLRPEEAAGKLDALRAYRTQFEVLNAGPIGLLTNDEVIGYELWWDVDLTAA